MAVTVRTYNIDAYWTCADVIDKLRLALADVGYLAPAKTGMLLTFSGGTGTTVAAARGRRYLVKQSATSGSGTGAIFDVYRHSETGAVGAVVLVEGGQGYAVSNTITIAGADVGGVTPTDNIVVTCSTVSGSLGGTTAWFDTLNTSPVNNTWGVARVINNANKMLGQTYWSFYMPVQGTVGTFGAAWNPVLYIRAGTGFNATADTFMGVSGLDYYSTNAVYSTTQQHFSTVVASSNTVPVQLKTYQSAIDPNFVVFQFSEASANGFGGTLYRPPFFLSKYDTAYQPWDLDQVFLGAVYEVAKTDSVSSYDCYVGMRMPTATFGKRQAEWAYNGYPGTYANYSGIYGWFESIFGKRYASYVSTANSVIYFRSVLDGTQTNLSYNPVVKGVPIMPTFIPVPYFLPNDFVIVEVPAGNNAAFMATITVTPGSEVYTVLQYGNNKSYNSYIAFAARTT